MSRSDKEITRVTKGTPLASINKWARHLAAVPLEFTDIGQGIWTATVLEKLRSRQIKEQSHDQKHVQIRHSRTACRADG